MGTLINGQKQKQGKDNLMSRKKIYSQKVTKEFPEGKEGSRYQNGSERTNKKR